jgi:RNA polymerase sigma factor (sigma-70 family)
MTCHTNALAATLSSRPRDTRELEMDRACLERAIGELHPASFAWALSCCGRRHDDAEDILQSVYVMVFDGTARFDGRSSLKTWLFGVIRHTALAHARKIWLRNALLVKWLPSAEPQAPDRSGDIERFQNAAHLVASLAKLTSRQREVIDLVFSHDMTVVEAAAVMRVGVGSARTHYDRGKKRLRALMAEVER